jgi:hypothetical protein
MKYFFGLPIHIIIIPVSCWMMIQFSIIGDCQNVKPGCFLGPWWLALLIQDDKIWQAVATLSVETCFHPRRVNHKGLPSGFQENISWKQRGNMETWRRPCPSQVHFRFITKSVGCELSHHVPSRNSGRESMKLTYLWLGFFIYCTTYWDQWPLSCRQYLGVGTISAIIWKLMI